MELEVGGVCEAFIAVGALEGSLARMGALMLLMKREKTQKIEKKFDLK